MNLTEPEPANRLVAWALAVAAFFSFFLAVVEYDARGRRGLAKAAWLTLLAVAFALLFVAYEC